MLGWLNRLFDKRVEAESGSAPLSPPPVDEAPPSLPAAEIGLSVVEAAAVDATIQEPGPAPEAKEICPTCGKTSVFAGPPGHRYCMHCALRQELFDASAAAHQ